MFRRRRRDADPAPADDANGSADEPAPETADPSSDSPPDDTSPDGATSDGVAPDGATAADEVSSPKSERPDGPYDIDEVDADEIASSHIDVGGLRIRVAEGMRLQFQVDKRTGKAGNVLIGEGEAAVQMVAVAAPRSGGLWGSTRLEIAADARRRGGSADEAKGPFGTELRVVVPVNREDGSNAVQPSRVSGIDGPRWMLRATFLGKAISDSQAFARLVEVVKGVVVVRGSGPMAPGDVIPLTAPAGAGNTEATQDGEAGADSAGDGAAGGAAAGGAADNDPGPRAD